MYVVFHRDEQLNIPDYYSLVKYLESNGIFDDFLKLIDKYGYYDSYLYSGGLVIIEPCKYEKTHKEHIYPEAAVYIKVRSYMGNYIREKKLLEILK